MAEQEMVQIRGTVDEVVFSNEATGFTVIELDTGTELIPAVGEMKGVSAGETLTLTGKYVAHPKFGFQFKVELYEQSLPETAAAIRKYLASGAVKGIGEGLAGRIVDAFGDRTLEILEKEPGRLAEVKGISPKKAEALTREFARLFGMQTAMVFLYQFGLGANMSVRIYKKWGPLTVDLLKQNPYLICGEDIRADFAAADRMAAALGMDRASPERIFAAIAHVLRHNLQNGHTCLSRENVSALARRLIDLGEDAVEIELDNRLEAGDLRAMTRKGKEFLFLPGFYDAEAYIAFRVELMLRNRYFETRDVDDMIRQAEQQKGITYETLQRQAIREALSRSILILTGGPGTGKTTTLNAIIDLLEQEGLKLAIAAPTGRAAMRISEVTGHEAKTIHRLLEVDFSEENRSKFLHNEQNPLDVDAVVIDEMSMVDVELFESLLRGIRPGCRLILVGDSNQLPSVGPGNVLRDLIASGRVPTVELKQIFRQAAESLIVTNAHRIIHGEMPDLSVKDRDFFFLSRPGGEAAARTVVELAAERLPKSYGYSPLSDIQVLAPQRRGTAGVNDLNARLQEKLNPPSPDKKEHKGILCVFREGDKVIQNRNNYDLEWDKSGEKGMGIFNGDIGLIRSIDNASAVMTIDFDGRVCEYPFEIVMDLELAYAITIHKSQGSEYDAVVLPVTGGYDKLYFRNLLYTAVTRARKLLVLVGSAGRVEFMVKNHVRNLRYTGLRFFLAEGADSGTNSPA